MLLDCHSLFISYVNESSYNLYKCQCIHRQTATEMKTAMIKGLIERVAKKNLLI